MKGVNPETLRSSRWWETVPDQVIAGFQLFHSDLYCPFDVFKRALETSLKRQVQLSEMTPDNFDKLIDEFMGAKIWTRVK